MTPPTGETVGALLDRSTRALVEAGVPEARADALALVGHALGVDRGGVLARRPDPVGSEEVKRIEAMIAARARRRPLQQITGRVEFHGLDLDVDAAVLVPRPETEGLVDAVLEAGLPARARIADLGTGSGCIAVALAVARPEWSVIAIDRDEAALAVAERNARRHAVEGRVRCLAADFARLPVEPGSLDAVVSNPPYVPEDEWRSLAPEVRDHEPKGALVPGPRGDEAYAAVARSAFEALVPGGLLALELGWTSEPAVSRLVQAAGFSELRVAPDLQGIPRVLTARR